MDIDSFIVHVKTKDIYEDIAENVEKRFDTSNHHGLEKSLSEKTKKSHWFNDDELSVKS